MNNRLADIVRLKDGRPRHAPFTADTTFPFANFTRHAEVSKFGHPRCDVPAEVGFGRQGIGDFARCRRGQPDIRQQDLIEAEALGLELSTLHASIERVDCRRPMRWNRDRRGLWRFLLLDASLSSTAVEEMVRVAAISTTERTLMVVGFGGLVE